MLIGQQYRGRNLILSRWCCHLLQSLVPLKTKLETHYEIYSQYMLNKLITNTPHGAVDGL